MPNPPPDHYAALEVPRTATAAEIRSAYRKLAREHHPDANPSPEAELRMRLINQAWETLKDPAQRSFYDRTLPRLARPLSRPMRAARPARTASRPAPAPPRSPFEDTPRAEARHGVEYTGDPTINWYRAIGVREDASRQDILKALSRMAEGLNGADITATEFARRKATMRDAWALLGDQYMRAAYDRARKAPQNPAAGNRPRTSEPLPASTPPAGYRAGPVTVNGLHVAPGSDLRNADLRGASLRGLDLAGVDLRDAKLQGADLESCSLRKAQLQGADLSGASLRFADLSNADATGTALRQADLTAATLRAASFFRANLAGASLANAAGPGINLDYADLARTDFTGAAITPQLIERGRLSATIMPNGTPTPG